MAMTTSSSINVNADLACLRQGFGWQANNSMRVKAESCRDLVACIGVSLVTSSSYTHGPRTSTYDWQWAVPLLEEADAIEAGRDIGRATDIGIGVGHETATGGNKL